MSDYADIVNVIDCMLLEAGRTWDSDSGTFTGGESLVNNEIAGKAADIEGDLVATAIVELMSERTVWEGTPTELLSELEFVAPPCRGAFWPTSPAQLKKFIARTVPALEAEGIAWETDVRVGTNRAKGVRLSRIVQQVTDEEEAPE